MMRKKGIQRIVVLIAILLVLDRTVGYFLDVSYEKNTCDYSNGKLNKFLSLDPIDTLILGSSRVLHMVDPELIGAGVKNLAFQQKHIYHNAVVFSLISDAGKLPNEMLVLNFEMEDLYLQYEQELLDQLYSLKYYYSKNKLAEKLINRKGYQERIKFLSHIYKHNGDGWKLLAYPMTNLCPEVTSSGYVPLIPSIDDSVRLAKSLIDDFELRNYEIINQTTIDLLEYLISTCKQEGIRLKIINGPYYKYHPEFIKASGYMKRFCSEREIEFTDFNELIIPGLNDKNLWYDNMHLNDSGASIYSTFLKRNL